MNLSKENIKLLKSKFLILVLLLIIVVVYINFARFSLPEAKIEGVNDDHSIAFIVYSLLLFSAALPTLIARISISIITLGLSIFAIFNWWFYDFYRDYLTFSIYKLALYTEETFMLWAGLKFKTEAFIFLISISILIFIVFYRLANKPKPSNKSLLLFSFCFLLLGGQSQYALNQKEVSGFSHLEDNPVSYFIKSIFPMQKLKITEQHIAVINKTLRRNNPVIVDRNYPLYQDVKASKTGINKNVIIVVLESVRAYETGLYTSNENDLSITPNLDKFSKQSINFSNYYANSNQTVRGELALLCSALDNINGAPISTNGYSIDTNCLPSILKLNGYETYWIHGYDKEFYNRAEFFPNIGFDHLLDQSEIDKNNNKAKIGWGINDVDVYDFALDKLEKVNKPFFAEILTLSNHYPFNWDWGIDFPKLLLSNNDEDMNLYNSYKKGIYYSDYAIGKFLERFKQSSLYDNTLLIITGDHGIWSFPEEKQNKENFLKEVIKNEKYYRLPLLIHAKEFASDTIKTPVSQIDIPPTVLDYLGISHSNAFIGQALLSQNKRQVKPIFFLSSGGYGYRDGDNYCYPADRSGLCGNYNRTCKSFKEVNLDSLCIESEGDLLNETVDIALIEVNQINAKLFIDLSQQFLNFGFMPKHSLIINN